MQETSLMSASYILHFDNPFLNCGNQGHSAHRGTAGGLAVAEKDASLRRVRNATCEDGLAPDQIRRVEFVTFVGDSFCDGPAQGLLIGILG